MESLKTRKESTLEIYNSDSEIRAIYKQAETQFSKRNHELFCKYDQVMVTNSLAKATRRKALRTILTLGNVVGKDYDAVNREDVDSLMYQIMQRFADNKGQETYSSYDNKKHIKIFLRWVMTGSRNMSEDGDPKEIRGIRMKTVKDRL